MLLSRIAPLSSRACSPFILIALLCGAPPAVAAPRISIFDDSVKLRGETGVPLPTPFLEKDGTIELSAMAGEILAFQIVIEAETTASGSSRSDDPYAFEYVHVDLPRPSETVPCAVAFQGGKCVPDLTKRVRFPGVHAEYFLQRFVPVLRPSGNTKEPGSLGFTAEAAPAPKDWVGLVADPLVPLDPLVPIRAPIVPERRTGVWIDLEVSAVYDPRRRASLGALAGDAGAQEAEETIVEGKLVVALSHGSSRTPLTVEKTIRLRVFQKELPFSSGAFTFYSRESLSTRLGVSEGDPEAERALRRLLHRHWIDGVSQTTDQKHLALEVEASSGALFRDDSVSKGVQTPSPGEEEPSSPTVFGIYGTLGDPTPASARSVIELHQALLQKVGERFKPEPAFPFVYAIDEVCKSPRVPMWRALLDGVAGGERIGVGVTCSRDVAKEPADLVMTVAEAFPTKAGAPGSEERKRYCIANGFTDDEPLAKDPSARLDDASTRRGRWPTSMRTPWAQCFYKRFWVYNGQRPYAGSMLLDVPATDLIANGWIAARYNVEKWFYWESIFWFDDNKGGKGGADGIDPFVSSENFHNQHGDYAQGDGLLVYPSTQRPNGFVDLKHGREQLKSDVIPSVRLKALRRGLQDRALVELARGRHPVATDTLVSQMVPRALSEAPTYPSWTENGSDYVSARHTLRSLSIGKDLSFRRAEKVGEEHRSAAVAPLHRLRRIMKYVSVFMMIALIYLMFRRSKT